jgi:phosphopantothenoylcysteine decarboxylase/phosphopantothenate--cysteine ligase
VKEATGVVNSGKKVVIAVTGGISAYKVPEVIRILKKTGIQVQVVATESALQFVGEATWSAISGNQVISSLWDETENVKHVELAKNTDLVVVVPATADTISDLATAKANSAVSALVLTTTAPVFLFPAMHTQMWEHAGTQENIKTLRNRGLVVFNPDKGELTSGDEGIGRLPDPKEIASSITNFLSNKSHYRILISAGGTKEAIDPVRYLTNISSGKQGEALAKAAAYAGFEVTLVSTVDFPGPWKLVKVSSANEMHQEMLDKVQESDIVIMAAAVADWTIEQPAKEKLKKGAKSLTLELTPTVDILKDLANKFSEHKVFIGFAAETIPNSEELIRVAREKLLQKNIDLICANDVSQSAVFGSEKTHLMLVSREDHRDLKQTSKFEAAQEILASASEIYQRKYPEK